MVVERGFIFQLSLLELSRGYVAYQLAGFGDPEVSASILKSENQLQILSASASWKPARRHGRRSTN
jgi:hypothetical protein